MNAIAVYRRPTRPRAAAWFAFALAVALTILPDCCLNGRHAFGFGMSVYGPICRASR